MTRLERLQKASFWVAVVGATGGFLTSAGCRVAPDIPPSSLGFLHLLLLILGGIAGYLSVLRGQEIDRERWRIAEDPSLTSGERDYVHRYAERQRRSASTSFLAAPLMLGYWLAYQVAGGGQALAAQLLPVTAVVGSVLGLLGARIRASSDPSPDPPRWPCLGCRNPYDLFVGCDALCQFAQRWLPKSSHAMTDGIPLDERSVCVVENQLLDEIGYGQDLEDPCAAEIAGAAALETPLAFVHLDSFSGRHGQHQALDLVSVEEVVFGTVRTNLADEPLGHGTDQGGVDEVSLDLEVGQSRNGRGRIVGVQGGEDQVAGQGGLGGVLRGLRVANLADHDDVGILTQDVTHRGGEGNPRPSVCTATWLNRGVDHLDRVFHRWWCSARGWQWFWVNAE